MAETPHEQTTRSSALGGTPEIGLIANRQWPDLVLSETETWVEDDLHVIRSTEFDLIAMHEDFDEAVEQFVSEAYSLFFALSDLLREGHALDQDRATYLRLSGPIIAAHRREREAEDYAQPRVHGDWRPKSSPATLAHA